MGIRRDTISADERERTVLLSVGQKPLKHVCALSFCDYAKIPDYKNDVPKENVIDFLSQLIGEYFPVDRGKHVQQQIIKTAGKIS